MILPRPVFDALARAAEPGELRERILTGLDTVQQRFAKEFVDAYGLNFHSEETFAEVLGDARALLAAKFAE